MGTANPAAETEMSASVVGRGKKLAKTGLVKVVPTPCTNSLRTWPGATVAPVGSK
jgi:hypothetical protein